MDLGQQKLRLKRRNDFQVVYLQDSHYSINSMPISFVIQLTHCCSAASLTAYVSRARPSSHSLDLVHYSLKLYALPEALIASECTTVVFHFKVKRLFSVSCFEIVVEKKVAFLKSQAVIEHICVALVQPSFLCYTFILSVQHFFYQCINTEQRPHVGISKQDSNKTKQKKTTLTKCHALMFLKHMIFLMLSIPVVPIFTVYQNGFGPC